MIISRLLPGCSDIPIVSGTEISNPVCSSGESRANPITVGPIGRRKGLAQRRGEHALPVHGDGLLTHSSYTTPMDMTLLEFEAGRQGDFRSSEHHQSVKHFHVHVLPRKRGDQLKLNWGVKPGDPEAIAAFAEKIRARL